MKKLSIFLTAFLFLTMAAGCSSGTSDTLSEGNNPTASFTKEIEPSASFTEAQLIHAFTSQGYSVIQNDPELDIEAKTVSINVFILMYAEWEDYLHTGNAFDYLPMTIAENLVF